MEGWGNSLSNRYVNRRETLELLAWPVIIVSVTLRSILEAAESSELNPSWQLLALVCWVDLLLGCDGLHKMQLKVHSTAAAEVDWELAECQSSGL